MSDLFSIIANVAYIGFFVAGMLREHRGKTLGDLIKACQHYWTGVALAAIVLVINLADVPNDGWLSPALNAFTLAACFAVATTTSRKRDQRALAEMQRDLGRDL